MKKNRLQRLVQSLTWIAPLRRHKYLCFVLWIFVLFLVDFFYYYYTVKLFSFFFCFVGVQLTYNIVLVSGIQQSQSVMYINISILFSHICYYKLLSRFSCAIQQVLINHLFYTVVCICYFHPPNSSTPLPWFYLW